MLAWSRKMKLLRLQFDIRWLLIFMVGLAIGLRFREPIRGWLFPPTEFIPVTNFCGWIPIA